MRVTLRRGQFPSSGDAGVESIWVEDKFVNSNAEIVSAQHAQWTRRRRQLGVTGVILGLGFFAGCLVVMHEATWDVVLRVGPFAALCSLVFGASMIAFAALPPRPATSANDVGSGNTFTMTAPSQWASGLWLWSALVSTGLGCIGIGLNYASRSEVISFNAKAWMVMGAAGVSASIFSPLRYIGRFRIDIESDGIRMELGRAYSGYVRWADIESVEPAARGRYALDLVLKPGARVENTSQWSPLYRLWAGVVTEASPFHDGYVRLECGGWTGDRSALLEEIVHHVPTPDVLDPEAADT